MTEPQGFILNRDFIDFDRGTFTVASATNRSENTVTSTVTIHSRWRSSRK